MLTTIFFTLAGAIYGSFLTAAIPRVAAGETLKGRSKCSTCRKTLGIFDLVPIFSFLFLRGKCRQCRKKISYEVFLTEIGLTAWGFSMPWFFPDDYLTAIFVFLFGGVLLAISLTDFRHREIPWFWIIFGSLLAIIHSGLMIVRGDLPITDLVLSFTIGAGWFAWQYFFSRGRWVGAGDIYMGGMLGLAHGFVNPIILNLGIAYVIGAIYAVILLITKKGKLKSQLPFGPFLAIGTIIVMLLMK